MRKKGRVGREHQKKNIGIVNWKIKIESKHVTVVSKEGQDKVNTMRTLCPRNRLVHARH